MRSPLVLLAALALLAALLTGCTDAGDRGADVTATPPTAPGLTAAQETILTQRATAQSAAQVDAAAVHAAAADAKTAAAEQRAAAAALTAATSDAERSAAQVALTAAQAARTAALAREATAQAALIQDQAASSAKDTELASQRTLQVQGQADRFYALGMVAALLAGLMLYEKNMHYAGLLGAMAATCWVIPSMVAGVLAHETAIRTVILLGAIALVVDHYRAAIASHLRSAWTERKALEAKLAAAGEDLAAHVEALGHAVARNKDFVYLDGKVGAILTKAWHAAEADGEKLLALIERKKATSGLAAAAAPLAPLPQASHVITAGSGVATSGGVTFTIPPGTAMPPAG